MTGNQLKILALVAMTLDHMGVVLFPEVYWLRVVGRLAFPIFAYMIAEGCFYTRNKKRYLGLVCALGVVCQVVYWFALGSLEQSILTTFALSIITIYAIQWWVAGAKKDAEGRVTSIGARVAVPVAVALFDAFVCLVLPDFAGHGFSIDYGLMGVLLPLWIYIPRLNMTRESAKAETEEQAKKRRIGTLLFAAVGLTCLALSMPGFIGGVQWWGLAALVPLALYNGQRGTWPLKYLFYIYYPLHLAVIYGISMLL
jgi:hypothetical protein